MVMFDEEGGYDVVESAERVILDRPVYDLDIADTHNFIADGIVTHNSIYGFRGSRHHQHPRVRGHVPGRARGQAGAELPLHTDDPGCRQRGDPQQPRARSPSRCGPTSGKGDPIKIRELDDEHAEARYVTGEIQRLVDEGTSRSEIAVFYRTNSQSRVLEDTLVRAEIAYQVIGGTKFYDRAEIKDAIAYLTVLVNPQDVGAFTRIINSPRRGIGNTTVSRLLAHANTTGETVWELAAAPEEVPGLGAAAIKSLRRFMGTMERLEERVAGRHRDLGSAQGAPGGDGLPARRWRTSARSRPRGGSRTSRSSSTSRSSTTRGPRSPRWPTSCSRWRSSPTPTHARTTRAWSP